ncbi:hypothetical protein G6F70_004396 [Rhizopus microsporus]|nr:hypothetical protein G6F71_001318 [Rhizopus microsporus]KAG1200042.1 hypothetical protein G6F70_004396 [Rhizopus microsporus]KAG1211217.1 hypothetical protein G6F69_004795 [Rhizopus microsporus]KAG1227861.1 hypothetical protein G6F67_008189 [Rhizopus microsporus]KAG1259924.1 hypothetical protein G6F68_007794 [Rhizopus microsporus]
MTETTKGIDAACQTDIVWKDGPVDKSVWTDEKLAKYRKMKRKLIRLIARHKEAQNALNTAQRRLQAYTRKGSKITDLEPMEISDEEEEEEEEEEDSDISDDDGEYRKKKRRYQKRRYSIQRNEDGSIQLPAQIVASLRIIELGRIDYERPAFHNDRYIFPIGYTAERTYMSMVDPSNQTIYTCKVEDSQDGPLFTLSPADAPDQCLSARTATGVWALVIKKVNEVRQKDSSNAISGPEYYGFSNPIMEDSRKRMAIDAIIDNDTLPLSPPVSYKSSSRSPSPECISQERRNSHPPMSAEERRYRNKLASAKYRAKKQQSMKNMASKVSQLMTSNYQLSRELAKVKQENEILRTMYERVISQQHLPPPILANHYALPPIQSNPSS